MKQYITNEGGSFSIGGMCIPNSEANRHYRKMQDEVSKSDAEILPYIKPELTLEEVALASKMKGVLFEGILCSATAEDMWGLSAIKGWILEGNSIPFKFSNGNTLLLTPSNLNPFEDIWVPFRASFFL